MKKLVIVFAFCFLFTACWGGDPGSPATKASVETSSKDFPQKYDPPYQGSDNPKPNNTEEFWDPSWREEASAKELMDIFLWDDCTSGAKVGLKETYQKAVQDEKAGNFYDASRGYGSVALKDDAAIQDFTRTVKKIRVKGYFHDPKDITVLLLGLAKCKPDNKEVRSVAAKIHSDIVASLKDHQFNPNRRYLTQKDFHTIDAYLSSSGESIFPAIYNLYLAEGDKSGARVWEIHTADNLMQTRSYDGAAWEPEPQKSYVLYKDAGLNGDAVQAATKAGDMVIEVFLNGAYSTAYSMVIRKPFNEYDKQLAMQWYKRANLSDEQAQARFIKITREYAEQLEKSCETLIDDCAEAEKLYTIVGETDKAARMKLRSS